MDFNRLVFHHHIFILKQFLIKKIIKIFKIVFLCNYFFLCNSRKIEWFLLDYVWFIKLVATIYISLIIICFMCPYFNYNKTFCSFQIVKTQNIRWWIVHAKWIMCTQILWIVHYSEINIYCSMIGMINTILSIK